MTSRYFTDRSDIVRRLAALSARALLGLGLAIVLSMIGVVIAWGLFIFSSSHDRTAFIAMNVIGAGIGASIGVNIAWIKLDRQQWAALALLLLFCTAAGVAGGLLGFQYGANREFECCADPRTSPFLYVAFGATIGANVILYLATTAAAVARMVRGGRGTVAERPR